MTNRFIKPVLINNDTNNNIYTASQAKHGSCIKVRS